MRESEAERIMNAIEEYVDVRIWWRVDGEDGLSDQLRKAQAKLVAALMAASGEGSPATDGGNGPDTAASS